MSLGRSFPCGRSRIIVLPTVDGDCAAGYTFLSTLGSWNRRSRISSNGRKSSSTGHIIRHGLSLLLVLGKVVGKAGGGSLDRRWSGGGGLIVGNRSIELDVVVLPFGRDASDG